MDKLRPGKENIPFLAEDEEKDLKKKIPRKKHQEKSTKKKT